jgi:hypothetical protein
MKTKEQYFVGGKDCGGTSSRQLLIRYPLLHQEYLDVIRYSFPGFELAGAWLRELAWYSCCAALLRSRDTCQNRSRRIIGADVPPDVRAKYVPAPARINAKAAALQSSAALQKWFLYIYKTTASFYYSYFVPSLCLS